MRWLKVVLGVLIVFGIVRYRLLLMQSFQYAINLNLNVLLCVLFILISILINCFRFRYFINKLGGVIHFKDLIISYFVSLSTIFSLVKFSDSIKILYLKKRGIPLHRVTTAYIAERIASIFVTSILLVLILGQYNLWFLVGSIFSLILLFLFLSFSHKLPQIKFIIMIKKFTDELKKLMKFHQIIVILFLTLFEFMSSAVAISFATQTNFALGFKTVVVGMTAVTATPTPGGMGFYETLIPTFLTQVGVPLENALGGILTYRFFSLWLPSIIGLILLQRFF